MVVCVRARVCELLLLLPRNKTTEDGRKDGKHYFVYIYIYIYIIRAHERYLALTAEADVDELQASNLT